SAAGISRASWPPRDHPKGQYIMRTAATLLILVLFGGPSFAQSVTLSGTVLAARTNPPLAGVRLSLDGQTVSATTDADGRFQLETSPGKHVVTASVIGFALSQ